MRSALSKAVVVLAFLIGAFIPPVSFARGVSLHSPLSSADFTHGVRPPSLYGSSVSLFTCEPAMTAAGNIPARSSAIPMDLAMADFTGDNHPDLVTVKLDRFDSSTARYLIEIELTEGGHQLLRLTGPPGGLFVTPKDVTGDGTLDLVVRVVGSQVPVAVFLNDGCGRFAAGEPTPSSRRLQDPRSDSELTSANRCGPAPAVASGTYTIEGQLEARRSVHELRNSLLLSTNRASSQLFLQFCSNRAPPAIS